MTELRTIMEAQVELLCVDSKLELGAVYIDEDGIDVGFVMMGKFDYKTIIDKLDNTDNYFISMPGGESQWYELYDKDDNKIGECYYEHCDAIRYIHDFRRKLESFAYEIGYVKITMSDGEVYANYFVSNT